MTKNIGRNRIVCLIPARKGSKRIKDKNLLKIKNKSLIDYACQASLSKKICEVYVATTCKKIINRVKKKHQHTKIYLRSKKSETSKSSTEFLISEFLKYNNNFDIMVLIQCTNVFIKKSDISLAINNFISSKYDSMFSAVKIPLFMWQINKNKLLKPTNFNLKNRPQSQNMNNSYSENGSFYIFNIKGYLRNKSRLFGKIGVHEMKLESIHEIDTYEDVRIVKKLK